MNPVLRLLFYGVVGGVCSAIAYMCFFWSTFSSLTLFLVYVAGGTAGTLIAATCNYQLYHNKDKK